jgi:hypothetical protein
MLVTPVATVATPIAAVVTPAVTIAPAAMVPGASADEDAAIEPLRAVVSIGGAGIRSIGVVAVLTYRRNRRRLGVTPADLDSK